MIDSDELRSIIEKSKFSICQIKLKAIIKIITFISNAEKRETSRKSSKFR